MIKYQNVEVPVFSIPPDWSTHPVLTERHGGLFFEALSTAEQRIGTQPRPLLSIQYDTLTMSEQESGYIRKVIEMSSSMPVAIPLWMFKRKLTASPLIGNSFVACDALAGAMFDAVRYAIIWNNFNYFETFTTFETSECEIQFAEPITKQFSPGDVVVPLILGILARDNVPAETDANHRFPVKFEEQFLSELFATPTAISGARQYGQPAFEYMLIGGPKL